MKTLFTWLPAISMALFVWLIILAMYFIMTGGYASGEDRKTDLVVLNIHGPYSPDRDVAKGLAKSALTFIKLETGAKIKLTKFRNYEGTNLPYNQIGTFFPLAPYHKVLRGQIPTKTLSLVLIPPYFDPSDGGVAIYGESFICALPGPGGEAGGGFVAIADKSPNGFDFIPYSEAAIIHELSHLIGSFHDDSEPINIMNSAALNYLTPGVQLGFSERSKRQIRRCFYTSSGRSK